MPTPLDNEFWKLSCNLGFKKTEKCAPISEECPNCHGNGEIGGGFKSIDGPEECSTCLGHGKTYRWPTIPTAPQLPIELVGALRKTFNEFFDGSCTEGNNCACSGDTKPVQQSCSRWKKGYSI